MGTEVNYIGPVCVTVHEDGVAVINMQDSVGRNALTPAMVSAIEQAFFTLAQNESVRAVVLSGLPDVFCSGADRSLLLALTSGSVSPTEIRLSRVILDFPLPCISAMEGHAVGGGFVMGICADVIILARESRYALNFMNMGFTPGMGSTRLLEHVLSPAIAHELLFTGEARRGRDFEARSGINYVLPRDQVLPKAMDLAVRIAEKPRATLLALKRNLVKPRIDAADRALEEESKMHVLSFGQRDVARWIKEEFISDGQEK